jgi:hypothetical protein
LGRNEREKHPIKSHVSGLMRLPVARIACARDVSGMAIYLKSVYVRNAIVRKSGMIGIAE